MQYNSGAKHLQKHASTITREQENQIAVPRNTKPCDKSRAGITTTTEWSSLRKLPKSQQERQLKLSRT